ncbi:MAG TPA: two-component regulator propeller domain-containing protein [Terracidiphilus sp.]|nr:two-component regulator propeller domain-containing protein [Terracidiphilus sp.]
MPGPRAAAPIAGKRPKSGAGKPISRHAVLAAFCAAVLLGASTQACAIDPDTPLADLSTQAWVLENGLPQNTVQVLAQTPDGFLWVGTEAGLARFDGSGFQVFDRNSSPALPASDIHCLLASADSSLWIGTSQGLARLKDGAVTVLTTRDGLPSNDIRALRLDDRGQVIVSTAAGEAGIEGVRVVPVIYDMLSTPDSASNVVFTSSLPDGRTAQATRSTVTVIQHGELRFNVGKQLPGTRIQALLGDREGSLWIGTNGGLARLVGDKLQLFPPTDSLSALSVLALLEDREGDLWIGTEAEGLHILRNRRFFTFGAREGLSSDATTTVVEDRTGTLWVGTSGSGLNAVPLRKGAAGADVFPSRAEIRNYSVKNGLVSNVILSLAAAPNGDLWVGTPDGLNRIRSGRVDTFTSADGLPDDFIRSLLVDSDGSLWVGTRHGLAHWIDRPGVQPQIKIYTQANGLGSDLVGAMTRDAQGDLWVATLAGLSRLHSGSIANFTTANGLSSNVVTALLPRRDGSLLIGTENRGLDLWAGDKFSPVTNSAPDSAAIHAILDDGHGHLWFATGNGIARCDYKNAAGDAGNLCTHWAEFGTADGLRSRQMATNSHPSAWQTRDGQLWFAAPRGLVEVDPAHFQLNTLPPPVVLERFAVDDVDQPLHSASPGLRIAAGHVHFQFDYAGLSYVAPQKIRYRYMLQGFDRSWTYAGSRRSAYYTNIPPGDYTFRVEAANNDGLWNDAGATLSFNLQRHFYQTLWFYALLLAILIAGIFLLLRRRLRLAEREFRAVLGERSRIAREIHDTLAQGYVGVSVQLELLAELLRMRKLDDAQKQLNATREVVREGLADARQSIWALRTQDSAEETLPVKLGRLVEQARNDELATKLSIRGVYRPLPSAIERELLRIAQEAIHNVKKHAAASELSVRMEYAEDTILLEVQDNGRGGAVPHPHGFGAGHFGVTGMKERAESIGGTLEIESAPSQGTTIRLRASVLAQAPEHAGDTK